MAVSMSATLSVNGQVIAGRKFTCTATLTEGGGTSTNLVSVSPFAYLPGANGMGYQGMATGVKFGTPANSLTIANYSGSAVTINANSSIVLNFDAVVDGPVGPAGRIATAGGSYYLAANCQTSDGSSFIAGPVMVTVGSPSTGVSTSSPSPNETTAASVILGTTRLQYANTLSPGQLRFDTPNNSNLIL